MSGTSLPVRGSSGGSAEGATARRRISTKALGTGVATSAVVGLAAAGAAQANVAGPYCGSKSAIREFPPTCVHTPAHESYHSLQGLFTARVTLGCVGTTFYSHPAFSQVSHVSCTNNAYDVYAYPGSNPFYTYAVVFRGQSSIRPPIYGHGYLNAAR